MTDYQSMYLRLFNVVSDAIEMLQAAQQTAEEIYVNAENSKQSSEAPSLPTESNP